MPKPDCLGVVGTVVFSVDIINAFALSEICQHYDRGGNDYRDCMAAATDRPSSDQHSKLGTALNDAKIYAGQHGIIHTGLSIEAARKIR